MNIEQLRVGDRVLAEDPATGRVEPERVLAAIDDGVKPTMTVGLSDGSEQRVTANHPFYVDSGPGVAAPEWVQAGDLRVGDRIRTEGGQDVSVAALRYHTGSVHVYTLTVANDRDFFVGPARVLVHNADCYDVPSYVRNAGSLVLWLQKIQNPAVSPTPQQVDRIIALANEYGVPVRIDPPHFPSPTFPDQKWSVRHLNIGVNGVAHVALPDGYTPPFPLLTSYVSFG